MRVLIAGPGAVGRFLAARIALTGTEVALLDYRRDRAERLTDQGIHFCDPHGVTHRVPVPVWLPLSTQGGVESELPTPYTHLLTCVKAHDTAQAVASAIPYLSPASVVVTLSNGLGNLEAARSAYPLAGSVAAATHTYGVRVDDSSHCWDGHSSDGIVRQIGTGYMEIGAPHAIRLVEPLIELLQEAGFDVRPVDDVHRMLWEKTAVNCAINPLAALLDVPNGELLRLSLEPQMRAVCGELVEVANHDGVTLVLEHLLERALQVCHDTAANSCSMRVDLRSRRKTEIDALNGAVAQRGEEAQQPTPMNSLLTLLVRHRERQVQPR